MPDIETQALLQINSHAVFFVFVFLTCASSDGPVFFLSCPQGWIDGVAILIAVLIVALVTASNDYSKELQFRALEKTSEETNRALVLRDGGTVLVRTVDFWHGCK